MTDRYTAKDAQSALARLASACGKPWAQADGTVVTGPSYQPTAVGPLWSRVGNENRSHIGAWCLDHNTAYGGYIVHEIANDGGAVSNPFGGGRRSARDFCDAVQFALAALQQAIA